MKKEYIMKNKRLLAILLGVLLVSGCSGVDSSKFEILVFHGHTYIAYNGNSYDSGLLHDPDCEFRDQKINEGV